MVPIWYTAVAESNIFVVVQMNIINRQLVKYRDFFYRLLRSSTYYLL